ncbi:TCR/Tet family MFS transporter [Roseobacter sp. N2S]|uniref:TCR/Tet family MFS transporter n=1 Tax=Roseobacter sp. N2S TaxID=2663844 RepID=UPI002863D507|nr:TCR/Tet family MFS transporter [Roseobacter sp. N2S]MDR6265941.1 DHA1 family tetracycline resistance protein-like MFS transporter [Roseobacter sp. N2S]
MSHRRAIYFILITVVIDAIGIGLIMPVMPSLLLDLGGSSLANAAIWGGILSTVFAAMQFLFGPLVGNLSDRFGRRKILLVSMTVMAVDYVLMGLAHALWLLFLARVLGGITAANHSTAGAVIADVSKPEEKAANFGLMGAAFGVGFILGPMLGGLMAEFGPRAPFYLAAVMAGANAVFGYFVLPETVTDRNRRPFDWRRALPHGAFRSVTAIPGQGRMMIVLFFQEIAFVVYPVIWAFYTIGKFGWEPWLVGVSLGAFGVMMAISQGVLIRIAIPRLGEYGTAILGLSMEMVAFVAIAFAPNTWVIFSLLPISAVGMLAGPAMQGIMSRAVNDDAQGELQGVVSSVRAMASIIAPLVMTGLFSWFTRAGADLYFPGAPFIASALLILIALLIFRGWRRDVF